MVELHPPAGFKVVSLERDQLPPPGQWGERTCFEFPFHGELWAHCQRPVSFRLRWLRETVRGMVRNPLPFQFNSGSEARITLTYHGEMRGRLWRAPQGFGIEYVAVREPVEVAAHVESWETPVPDPLLAALVGVHPLEWFRQNAVKGGSWEWLRTSYWQQAPVERLEQIAAYWERLDLDQEARAWESFGADGALALAALDGDQELFEMARRIYRYCQSMLNPATWTTWATKRVAEQIGSDWDERLDDWRHLSDRVRLAASEALQLMLSSQPALGVLARGSLTSREIQRDDWQSALAGEFGGLEPVVESHPKVEIKVPFATRYEIRTISRETHRWKINAESPGLVSLRSRIKVTPAEDAAARTVMIPLGAEYSHQGRRWDTAANCMFTHVRQTGTSAEWEDWEELLAYFGLELPPWPGKPVRSELRVTLPGSAFAVWLDAPSLRQAGFDEVFERVAVRLQVMLRSWLPALWFRSPERFANLKEAYPLLAYAASPLAQECKAASYTLDPTRAGIVLIVREGIRKRGQAVLERAARRLSRMSALDAAEATSPYSPGHASKLARIVHRRSRPYEALLRREARLMEELLRFPSRIREIRLVGKTESSQAGYTVSKTAGRIAHDLRKAMKGDYVEEPAAALEQLLLMEATAALQGENLSSLACVDLSTEHEGWRRTWRR